ncbi:alpha/beta hydrolase [Streptomyces sp. CHA1]|uniref:alpha/beta fold hydrolase n=1 Tax=unclassified Streptomyces TaxID=2593676 RepID=UPI001BFC71B7|nr:MULTISPECIES: alpha/beta hydrolase [unclassified Streptomyces]UYM25258.1 alpha/beta hydrolase [Streptomyces albus]MBT3160420.1 alpha/beta hydrolase [Streptomyces sp. G11C]MCO6700461.1 alpha/beta hydrolase [Streptomyces sp. CHB9.2]MCO6706596.1 alpha/beta hydrolase [Streptomyces sp. CHA3]MCO6712335.1 alpha/beta hydrolase [Streptomyces sp. CHB19.2]
MDTVVSRDGTPIVHETRGSGPALVLVGGAMTTREHAARLAGLLADSFTVVTYDRRGRGRSGDTRPYAVRREVEDLAEVIRAVGGPTALYGVSSGAALALHAAAGPAVSRVALYEPPFTVGGADPSRREAYRSRLVALLAADDRGGAVELFMTHIGLPPELIAGARQSPAWPGLEAVAPTLAYDDALLGDGAPPLDRLALVSVPALVMAGSASPPAMTEAARAVAEALPDGTYKELDGQSHDVAPEAVAAALREFLLP